MLKLMKLITMLIRAPHGELSPGGRWPGYHSITEGPTLLINYVYPSFLRDVSVLF